MKNIVLPLICIAFAGCKNASVKPLETDLIRSLSNPAATASARQLYHNLQVWQKDYTMVGHQDDLAYGVEWKYEYNRSDIKDLIGDYPAVLGWDIGGLELNSDKNLDQVPFDSMRVYMQRGHEWGSINTVSWHLRNPVTGGNSWDTSRAVKNILPGGDKHALYIEWLSVVADFLGSVKDEKGEMIPILFRPYHELTGHWFWWCKPFADQNDFVQLWKMTYDYLIKERKLNHLIFVYNTAEFDSKEAFLLYYPGDEYVDMISFDAYQHGVEKQVQFLSYMKEKISLMNEIGAEKNMPTAVAETGLEAIPDTTWWTGTVQAFLKDNPTSYILFWRNHGWKESLQSMHYYMPYKGQVSADNFVKFMQDEKMLSAKDVKRLANKSNIP
ncbi:glycoside hydrolase family 26 protein [Gynurincola endophyticus]|uniref:glycoside hydrolase family 26 protein n=1 Tax=Gynurincola endophyticus TaxID=2479004 RepID=UPI000F8F7F0E|nr:glycosyl hydrolase [Gynurincola endophyticus]